MLDYLLMIEDKQVSEKSFLTVLSCIKCTSLYDMNKIEVKSEVVDVGACGSNTGTFYILH